MAVQLASRIVFDPTLKMGKPVIEGTQIPVEEVLTQLASGMTVKALAESYQITMEDIQAALKYAAKKLSAEFEVGSLLEESVRAGHYEQFVSLVEAVDWATRLPDELTKAIDLALSLDMTKLAVKLAELGERLFPDHERLQQAAQVLAAPAEAGQSQMPRIKGKQASMDWFEAYANQYRGQWVAVREGKLLAAAPSFKELEATIRPNEDPISTIISRVLP